MGRGIGDFMLVQRCPNFCPNINVRYLNIQGGEMEREKEREYSSLSQMWSSLTLLTHVL